LTLSTFSFIFNKSCLNIVMPVKTGIQCLSITITSLDSRFRGNDVEAEGGLGL
jgi:hypothetical protein